MLPLVVCVATSSTWSAPLLLVALFLTLELTATNVVEPWLFRSRTGISSLALLTMAIFWTLLWGWPGLILSTPLTVCIVVLGRYVPQMSFLHALLGADAELSAEAVFYERLLAMDQREARAVANRFLEERPLVELYDSVVIPALALVEQDRHQGTLEEGRCNFFFLTIGELVAELTDFEQRGNADPARPGPGPWHAAGLCGGVHLRQRSSGRADDPHAGPVDGRGLAPVALLPSPVSDEILDSLANEPSTVIFISALPPFAFSQARGICQRVRTHLPQNRIVIGLWSHVEEPDWTQELTAERFGDGRPTAVVNTLAQAVRLVSQWHEEAARASSFSHSSYEN